MKFYDVADLAVRNLRESVFRNSLTTIGISVGVASLVAMLSLGIGLQQLASRRLQKSGLFDTVVATSRRDLRNFREQREDGPPPAESPSLDESARQKIAQIPGVVEAYPDIRFVTDLRFDSKPHLTMVAGVPFSAKNSNDAFDGMQGSFFSSDGAAEAILQKSFAEELLGITPKPGTNTTNISELAKSLLGKELTMRYAERTVYLTDGTSDVTHAADLYANERAAKIAPIRMTGNYGGEVLRRIRAFKPGVPSIKLYRPEILPSIHAARDTYNRIIQVHPLSFSVFRQAPWHHYGLQMLEQTQLSLRSPYLDNELVRTVFRAPMSALSNSDVSLRLITDGDPALRKIRTDRGLAGKANSLSSAITRGILEFSFKAEYAYDYGMPQWVARIDHFFAPLHLERLFLGRHKFYHFRVWYRDALSKYVREMLLDPRSLSRPYLERDGLETIVRGHLKGDQNFTSMIHKVLTLEILHRRLLDMKLPSTDDISSPAIQVHSVVP